jgi:hypothetical protein
MGTRRLAAIALVALVVGTGAAGAGAAGPVRWSDYLPTLAGGGSGARGIPGCARASKLCIVTEIRSMRGLQRRLGCDHRAVFDTTYLELTRTLYATVAGDRRVFADPRYLFLEDALFAHAYFVSLSRYEHGQTVPAAWQIAFDTARTGEVNAGQDMLLGINAHVQNDMPYVLASLGLRTPSGASRKPDHDAVNGVLAHAYQRVVGSIARRYDPLVATTNSSATPVDDTAGLQLVKRWREDVWHNAERLLAARDDAERRRVSNDIQENAASWARAIASTPSPGYRAQRDDYCRRQLRR